MRHFFAFPVHPLSIMALFLCVSLWTASALEAPAASVARTSVEPAAALSDASAQRHAPPSVEEATFELLRVRALIASQAAMEPRLGISRGRTRQ